MIMIEQMIKERPELHIQQSIDVTTVPAKDPDLSIQQENQGQSSIVTYVKTDFFNVYEWRVSGILKVKNKHLYISNSY